MKKLVAKMFATLAVIALVMLFVSVALLIGARAVAGAENNVDEFVLVAFAGVGVVASTVKSLSRPAGAMRNQTSLRITSRNGASTHGAFLNVPSSI